MSHLINSSHNRLGAIAIAGLLIATFTNPCTAQILIWPPEDTPPPKTEPAEEEIKTLQISPAAEPEPALRYRFWPAAGEETPGNVMTLIQRANAMRLEQRAEHQPDPFYENYEQWMGGPLEELPKDAVRKYLKENEAVLTELHRAASMEDSEYAIGLGSLRGMEAIRVLLNDVQNARDLARLLALESRFARSEQRLEDAILSLKAGFRLAEAVGQSTDHIISRLVGFAITGMMLGEVQELITTPGSPNLYWALASLPPSIWEIRAALMYEANVAARLLPSLNDLPETGSSHAEWQEQLVGAIEDYREFDYFGEGSSVNDDPDQITQSQLLAGILVLTFSDSARGFLQQIGYSPEEVAAMSPSEALMRGTWERLRRIQDDFAKWALLPGPWPEDYWREAEKSLVVDGNPQWAAAAIIGSLMPAARAANSAATRAEQNVAFMTTIEAIRMHAAEHGQFPESLEHLQPVPAFPDTATGKHFGYKKISETEAKLERTEVSPGQPDTKLRLELRK